VKIFFDTNVLLSATIFPGLCDELLVQCMNSHTVLSSALVRAEGHAVLVRKFPRMTEAPAVFDSVWKEVALIDDAPEPGDDNDARLVAAAAAAGADLFVTGDRRVLEWHAAGTMRIVSPREAWTLLFPPSAQP
jgi:predicted nucleic acid-binding protein